MTTNTPSTTSAKNPQDQIVSIEVCKLYTQQVVVTTVYNYSKIKNIKILTWQLNLYYTSVPLKAWYARFVPHFFLFSYASWYCWNLCQNCMAFGNSCVATSFTTKSQTWTFLLVAYHHAYIKWTKIGGTSDLSMLSWAREHMAGKQLTLFGGVASRHQVKWRKVGECSEFRYSW